MIRTNMKTNHHDHAMQPYGYLDYKNISIYNYEVA